MIDERAPCPLCRSTFRGLCSALDAVRSEAAELRAERYRHVDGPPIAKRAPSPPSPTIREELRSELDDARHRIAEIEKANAHLRHVAEAERRRADAAQDAVARSYRAWLDIPAARHA